MNYSEAVEFIQSFPDSERGTHGSRGLTMSLDSMRSLLKRLGNPEVGRRTIHVTGSKGKGSTCTMIATVLKEAGVNTALFTSPHLHSYCERIQINLQPISEEAFAKALDEIKPFVEEESAAGTGTISTFGILTAMFFHITKNIDPRIEWQIVEVGMGGRFDATNVFETKEMAVITPISLEHVEVLGSSPTEIAMNKGAIITAGCTAVLSAQKDASVRNVIGRQCHLVGADLVDAGSRPFKIKMLSHDLGGQSFSLDCPMGNFEFSMSLLGTHQVVNACTAAIATKVLADRKAVPITDENIKSGLAKTRINGRFEIFQSASRNGVAGPTVIVDGAHNNESAAALAATLKALFQTRKCIFVIGVNNDKNINAIWRELHPLSKTVISTRSHNLRAMDPGSIADAVSFQTTPLSASTESVPEAMELAIQSAEANDIICVTGSLYVVAEARDYLIKNGLKT